jgi:hypothetical protein
MRAWATPGLDEQVSHRFHLDLPTPTPGEQSSSDGPNSHRQWQTPATDQQARWATPAANEASTVVGRRPSRDATGRTTEYLHRQVNTEIAKLNPNFVDWLMGWPPGMSACEPLETASFRSWQRVHSSLLRDVLG